MGVGTRPIDNDTHPSNFVDFEGVDSVKAKFPVWLQQLESYDSLS